MGEQRHRTKRAVGGSKRTLTPDEINQHQINIKYLCDQLGSWDVVEEATGVSKGALQQHMRYEADDPRYQQKGKRITKGAYDAVVAVVGNTSKVSQVAHVGSNKQTGDVLAHVQRAHRHLRNATDALRSASAVCEPIARLGFVDLARQFDELREQYLDNIVGDRNANS
jgi:hypothetical protein